MEKKYRSAKDLAVWRINEAEIGTKYHRTLVDTAELVCNKNFSLSDLRSTIVQNFMTNDNYFTDILQKLFDGKVDLNEADYGLLYAKCKTKCCENFVGLHGNDFFHGIMNSGYFLYSQASIGLGTFLANFANMSIDDKSKGKEWSTFNLESTIKFDTTFEADKCNKISKVDILLHKFFEDLALFIGFPKNEPVSLFDVPSMLGIKEDMADQKTTTIKEAILYSQCNRGTLVSAFHSCYSEFWHLYIQQNVEGNTTWYFYIKMSANDFDLIGHLWRLRSDMKLENKDGIVIFPDKNWEVPNENEEGFIRAKDTNEVLGFNDLKTGEL